MRPLAKLAAFALILAAAFGVGAALGAALPDQGPTPVEQHSGTHP